MAISGSNRWITSSPGRRAAVLFPLVLAIDVVVVLALGLLPLNAVAGLRCEAVLRGGDPEPNPSLAGPIRLNQESFCNDVVRSRRLTMIVVGALGLVLGTGAVLAPADRLERFLVRRPDEGEGQYAYDEEAARAAEAREARIREERALADARREARAREEEERLAAAQASRAERVARARAARHRARAEAAAGPAKKTTKKTATRTTKKAAKKTTKKVAKRGTATKVAATGAGAPKKLATKKVVTAKKAVTKAGATKAASTKVTPKRAASTKAAAKKVAVKRVGTRKAPGTTKVGEVAVEPPETLATPAAPDTAWPGRAEQGIA